MRLRIQEKARFRACAALPIAESGCGLEEERPVGQRSHLSVLSTDCSISACVKANLFCCIGGHLRHHSELSSWFYTQRLGEWVFISPYDTLDLPILVLGLIDMYPFLQVLQSTD